MSYVVLVLLSILWLGFFLPSLLQARRTSSPYASATSFQASLRRLSAPPEELVGSVPPPSPVRRRDTSPRSRAAARRADVLMVLSAATTGGAVVSLGFGGVADWAFVPPATLLVAYLTYLRRSARRREALRHRIAGTAASAAAHGADALAPEPLPPVEVSEGDLAIVLSVRRREVAATAPERIAG